MTDVSAVAERFDRLEEIMMQLAYEHTKTEMELRSLSREMKDFKQEMRALKKENDRRWGDLANKLGTLVEDIVAPSLPGIVRDDFGFAEIDRVFIGMRVRDKHKGAVAEFDAVLVAGGTVFINETKSKPKIEHVDDFLNKLERVYDYLPEYAEKSIVPFFSSMYIRDDIVQYLTRHSIYALGMGEDFMEVLNLEQVKFRGKK